MIFKVFDLKLDHPKAIVINCVYTRVNLNPRNRKHYKQIMSVGKQQQDLYQVVHTISLFLKVFDPKLDHSEANVIKGVFIKVNLRTTYRKHVKHTCEHQISTTLFFFEAVHRISL